MEAVLASYDIETVKGNASFSGRDTVKVLNGEKDEVRKIFADKFIIASGTDSSALKEFAFDGDRIISSTNALDLKEMPESMLIIGGGAIGIEMATVFSGFGCRVTLAEYESYLLPNEDREISEEIRKNLAKQSVEVWVACSDALNSADNYEKVLIVTGRTPNSVLGLEEIGVRKTEKGFIETDEFCRTSVDNIYAVGDITGKNLLAYAAQNEGAVAAENAAGLNSVKVTDFAVPQVVFSMPPSSSIKVKDFSNYKDVIFGKFPFAACGRAFIEKERTGFVKCAVDKKTRKLLAFWIVGAHSDELINTASQIIVNGMGCLSRESIFHPSLSESLLNAYEDAFGRCVELVKNKLKL
jgi:dihydrolipoamide dehydrogenase